MKKVYVIETRIRLARGYMGKWTPYETFIGKADAQHAMRGYARKQSFFGPKIARVVEYSRKERDSDR